MLLIPCHQKSASGVRDFQEREVIDIGKDYTQGPGVNKNHDLANTSQNGMGGMRIEAETGLVTNPLIFGENPIIRTYFNSSSQHRPEEG